MTQRRRRWFAFVSVLAALAIGRGLAGLIAGAAQAEALGVQPSWRLFAAMDLSLRVMIAAVAALVLFANLLAVRHSIVSIVLPRQLGNLRFAEAIPTRVLTLGAAGLALAIGALFASVDLDGQQILLALHGVRFGEADPILERDIAWYLIGLPGERALWDYALSIVAVAGLLTIALYAGTPSMRVREGRLVVTGWVRRHLGVLGGVGLVLLAWHWRLERYELLVTGSGVSQGFGAVDHRLVLPYLLGLSILTGGIAGAFVSMVWIGATRLGMGLLLAVLVVGPLGRVALVTVGPSLGATTRGIREREASYDAIRARFTARAHGEAVRSVDRGPLALDSLQRLAPAGAIILPDGGRYRMVRDTTGRVAAPSLTTWGQRISQAWALQNPRLAWAGGAAEDRLLVGASPWSRVTRVAPFLRPAPTPRAVEQDGWFYWVLDLTIEGEWYPFADPLPERRDPVRYHRPAGVAVVDAMTGAVRIVPPADPDPILRAWMTLVPDVFAAGESIPDNIAAAAPLSIADSVAEQSTVVRLAGPEAPAVSPEWLRSQAAALYDAMETARRAGDWAAYGTAWRQLGVLLGRPAP